MKKFAIIFLVALSFLVLGCTQPPSANTVGNSPAGYIDITPEQAKQGLETNPGAIIIDVSDAYAQGHIPNAINIPLAELDNAIPNLDKTKQYLVYCHTDSASKTGAQKLVDAGFKSVFRLEGNFAAWVAAGYETESLSPSTESMSPEECEAETGRIVNTTTGDSCTGTETNIGNVTGFISPNICCVEG